MSPEDPIQADYVVTRDRFGGGGPPGEFSDIDDKPVLLEFALYILLNMACAALGLLIWIV